MIGLRNAGLRERVKWVLLVVPSLLVAAFVGVYSVGHPKRALAFGGLVVVGLILLDLNGRKGDLVDRFKWIPIAWVALVLVSDVRLLDADPLAVATGSVNIQHVVQLTTYGVVTALVVRARGSLLSLYPQPVPKGLLLTLPLVAVASALWSLVPLYTFVRGVQLLVVGTLALLLVRIWLIDRTAGEEIFARTMRVFVQVVTMLTVIGLLWQPEQYDRFAWQGVHPTTASTYVGAALIILIAGRRSLTRFSVPGYWGRLLLFTYVIFLGQTRSVLAGVVVAVALALWLWGREKPVARYLGVTYYIAGTIMLVTLAATQLFLYLSRGEDPESLVALTGRVPLWEFALGEFDSIREWALGFGYGSSRFLLLSAAEFQWAGSAHSAWMELLLGTGIVGVLVAAATITTLTFWLLRPRYFGVTNLTSVTLLMYLLIASPVLEPLALPGIGFGLLALFHAPALAQRGMRRPPARQERGGVGTDTRR